METAYELPELNAEEIRVLGSLIEKSKVTPDNYPLTLNSLMLACNQKSSRHPVVNYDESTVSLALDSLKRKGFVSTVTGGGGRTIKYQHNVHRMFDLPAGGLTAICLLFLRGPLTPGEINSNSGRMYVFDSLAQVQETLQKMAEYEIPLVKELPRQPGQKERRFAHLFSGDPGEFVEEVHQTTSPKVQSNLEERIQQLEEELAEVKGKLEELIRELMG